MNEQPTHIDLCSGIGGFALAAHWAGFRTIGFAEIARFPSIVITHRFPGIPNWGDIRNTPPVHSNLLTCGDPCQPFSVAGRRRGEDDDRYLWPAVLDAIGRHHPDWLLLENVVGIKGLVLSRRFDDLAARGYQPSAFDIPSCAVGLPSVERHIWIVAASKRQRLERGPQTQLPWQSEQGTLQQQWWSVYAADSDFQWGRYLSNTRTLRSRKGIPDFVDRIVGIGNAIPPPVAFQILKTIRELI